MLTRKRFFSSILMLLGAVGLSGSALASGSPPLARLRSAKALNLDGSEPIRDEDGWIRPSHELVHPPLALPCEAAILACQDNMVKWQPDFVVLGGMFRTRPVICHRDGDPFCDDEHTVDFRMLSFEGNRRLTDLVKQRLGTEGEVRVFRKGSFTASLVEIGKDHPEVFDGTVRDAVYEVLFVGLTSLEKRSLVQSYMQAMREFGEKYAAPVPGGVWFSQNPHTGEHEQVPFMPASPWRS